MLKALINYVIPPTCPGCQSPTEQDHTICVQCWKSLVFITSPFCDVCTEPLEVATENKETYTCGSCLQSPPAFIQTRSLFKYSGLARQVVLNLKHGGATYLSPLLGRLIIQHHASYINQCDLIIPVPLHWSRLLKRGYNQASLISKNLAKHSDISFVPDGLIRKKRTPSQGNYSKSGRLKNVKSAFSINLKATSLIKGKTILLVDDVVASGATLNECAKVLLTAGAKAVKVLVVAKSTLNS